ncbi:MAG: phage portal protein [Bacillota bacterium]|jgi:A118 family predicted phage portal protein
MPNSKRGDVLNSQEIIKILNKKLGTEINADYYKYIYDWHDWWAGKNAWQEYKEKTADKGFLTRQRYSLNMAKKCCEDWASYLVNEKTDVEIDDEQSDEYLLGERDSKNPAGLLNNMYFWERANTAVEIAMYSGTAAMLLQVDLLDVGKNGDVLRSQDATIRVECLPAMSIFPLSTQYGQITEAAFASSFTKMGKKYLYLEIHTLENGTYVIENLFYEVVRHKIKQIETPEGVAAKINTGSPYPFFVIVSPNIVNHISGNMGLGCSIYAQAIDCIKGLDLAYNNFNRDLALSGKKVFYNRELLSRAGLDNIAPDDVNQQLFVRLPGGVDDVEMIKEFNPEIRVEENIKAVQAQLDYLSFKCGMGTRHYRFEAGSYGAKTITATQYTGEKQELKQHAAKHSIVIQRALENILRSMLWIAKNYLGKNVDPDTIIMVNLSDGYIISDEERRANDLQELSADTMTKYEFRSRWQNESEETAKKALVDGAQFQKQLDDIIVDGGLFGEKSYGSGEDE